jgi:hypothetical protein
MTFSSECERKIFLISGQVKLHKELATRFKMQKLQKFHAYQIVSMTSACIRSRSIYVNSKIIRYFHLIRILCIRTDPSPLEEELVKGIQNSYLFKNFLNLR